MEITAGQGRPAPARAPQPNSPAPAHAAASPQPSPQHQPPQPASPSPGFEPRPVITKRDIKRTINVQDEDPKLIGWTNNRWGRPGQADSGQQQGNTVEAKRARKFYQLPIAPIRKPESDVFASLADLETLMRATLGALASFNEDERMILTKQFRREEQIARERGLYAPPGLVSVPQFRHAWKKFSVRVSEAQADALFIKYGCDTQGLLPYDLFAQKLLSSPARLLARESEQKGPYRAGKDATFNGKIVYRFSRTPVFPPSGWDGTPALRSARKPKAGLQLEFAYGYNGFSNTSSNVFYNADAKLVYFISAVAVVYDPVQHTQQFFEGHDDDILSMAMHPDRIMFATGQTAAARDDAAPYVAIWDSRDLCETTRIDFPAEGNPSRYIVALAFSPDGKRLVVVTADNRHTVYVFNWKSKQLVYSDAGYTSSPPAVYGVVWNTFLKRSTLEGGTVPSAKMFLTYGVKHVKFWLQEVDTKTGRETYTSTQGKFGHAPLGDVTGAAFACSTVGVTGCQNGQLLLWDLGGRGMGSYGTCYKIIDAHGLGVTMPSLQNGQLVLQGVRCMALRAGGTELLTAGSDGCILVWDLTGGEPGHIVRTMQLQEPGETTPCSFTAMACQADGEGAGVVVGTNRCEIWEFQGPLPELVLQGHNADVFGCAFHPIKPWKFATACDSSFVYLFNCKRRQLIAKVHLGTPARSVAFSPNGAHLAVGCESGMVKVLMVEQFTNKVAEMHDAKEQVGELKYSPDGCRLAAASNDNYIYIYDVTLSYQRLCRCAGHSSYITHVDWCVNSRILQSTCGAGELLYFEATTGKQVRRGQRDTQWDEWTCTLGFPVMGIWRSHMDITDINACCRSHKLPHFQDTDPLVGEGEYVVSAADDGRVRLYNYPCVVQDAACREYIGHCSHVTNVRFAPDNRWVVSVGGRDQSAFQWRVFREARDDVLKFKEATPDVIVFEAPQRLAVEDGLAGYARKPGQIGGTAPGEGAAAAAAADAARRALMDAAKKKGQVVYEITVITADVRGAGTDSGVFMVMYGDKASSGEIRLESGPTNFTKAKTDVFTMELPDCGAIDRIRIGHDSKGLNSKSWCLDRVLVQNKTAGTPPAVFISGQWFSKEIGDGLTIRLLRAGEEGPEGGVRAIKYKVTVKTADVKGAGTSANVYITLYGETAAGQKYESKPIQLENNANNFQRGAVDVFDVEASIGELKFIKIGHDNSGLAPGWSLQAVEISYNPTLQFPANRWLATDQGDGQTYCVLYPTGADAAQDESQKPHRYQIQVATSDLRGAGTDANVSATLFGSSGRNSGAQRLETSKNNFERGARDIFFIDFPDLGDIVEVDIGHDNSGPAPGWHLQEVLVIDETTNKRYVFPCDRWFALDEDDHLIRRRLKAVAAGAGTTTYRVVIYTSDLRGAATSAKVYVELIGQKPGGPEMVAPPHPLENSSHNFDRGGVDTFLLHKHRQLSPLAKIRLGHDNSGLGPGWHVNHVEVTDDATGELFYFPCDQWFDKGEGDGLIERVLVVAKSDPTASKAAYKVTVHTSDIRFAGTDANVFIELMGNRDGVPAATGRTTLNSSKNDFERGAVDVFNLTLPNIGTLERICIGHDNFGAGAAWHLNMVEVLCVNTGQHASFFYNNWLSKEDAPYQLEVLLTAAADGGKPPDSRYQIVTFTSDIRGAGTDANVSCKIFGDKGDTQIMPLDNSRNNFEKGARDEFVVQSIDVGVIKKLQIGHDNKGLGPAWHLEHVEVLHESANQRYYFMADRWLDAKAGTTTIFLEPVDSLSARQKYKISVQTGDVKGAGTDADISIILMSDVATTPEHKLENSSNNFEKNQLDDFLLDMGSKFDGEVSKVDIGFATQQTAGGALGGLFGKSWYLTSVEVVHLSSGTRTFFLYDDWISDKKRRVQLVPSRVGANNTYKVIVKTSDIRGAGTDSNITITMFGAALDSGLHKLDSSKNDFERGSVDTFMIKCKDLGEEVTRIVMTSDGSGLGPAWHLQEVEVFDTARGKAYTFPCEEWLDPKDMASLSKELYPAGSDGRRQQLQYDVTVYTSDLRGAGTDANVALQIWGDKSHTAMTTLDTKANNFERGNKDVFAIKSVDMGELQYLIVRKDASGLGEEWHLQSIDVFHPGLRKRFFFTHNNWLKGICEIKLEAGKVAEGGVCSYRLVVYTSDIRGAGTDANITAVLAGVKGDTGERKLDSSANDFERGKVDTFFFTAPDVGEFHSLRITSDNSGIASAWHLAKVEATNMATGESWPFPCNRWIDKEHGLSVLLTPDRDGDGVGDALIGGSQVKYTISTYTSDIRGAGTDANVSIQLFGDKGAVGETRLDNATNNFERGMKDTFEVSASNVGELQRIIIRHDNSGMGSAWHLEQVEVLDGSTGRLYVFPCGDWLQVGKGGDMSGCSRELFAGAPGKAGPTTYKVAVFTSDLRGAGTDADIFITIYGPNGDTGERALDSHANNFERGQVDTFILKSGNIGEIQRIKVRSSDSGLGSAWHLNKIEITSSADSQTLVFQHNNWFDKKNGLDKILYPDGKAHVDGDTLKYKVSVFTSDIRGAGTDANVFLEMVGDKGFIGATQIETKQNNFERGAQDDFIVTGSDIGELQEITIGHDNSGLGSAWHLAQVEVTHPLLNKRYTFPCDDWLLTTKELGLAGCRRTLKTGAGAAADGRVTYKVTVQTSDVRGAGTDADIFITIFGPKGDTGERQIESHGNNFERGQVDTFVLTGPDIGDPERIKVRSSNSGLGAAWHLAHVNVASSATNMTYNFPYNDWFDEKKGLEHVLWRDGLQGTLGNMSDYRITTYTSDIRGAGTDANVSIELFGTLGNVGQTRLDNARNNFERGEVDNFVVKATDIGDVTKIIISHDNSGIGSAWHLMQVEVFNPATQRVYYFPCDAWLEKNAKEGMAGCRKELLAGQPGAGGPAALCKYRVDVQTGDVRGAGTDADVKIIVFGALGDTGLHDLNSSRNDFERNNLDTFFFMAPDIGPELSACKVVCSGTGMGAAWNLAHITVTNTKTGVQARFNYNGWFDDKAGWMQVLTAEGSTLAGGLLANVVDYEVTVFTSDVRFAATDGAVYVQFVGQTGVTGETQLENDRSNFSRARKDVFLIQGSDVGPLLSCTVRMEPHNAGSAWHLQQIDVLNKKTGARAHFLYNDWINKEKLKVTIPEATSEAGLAANAKLQWKITTQTSDLFGAGTDAPVFVQIWGPLGMLGGAEINLDNSKNNFERGDLDDFFVEFPLDKDCGTPVTKLVVERGGSVMMGADWHLDSVRVEDLRRGHVYLWRIGAWFNTKEGLKREWTAERAAAGEVQPMELVEGPPTAVANADLGSEYRIAFVTSDKMLAGTDAKVAVEFEDDRGAKWRPVLMQTKGMFERAHTDEFVARSMVHLGEIVSARVWIENPGIADGWHLESLRLTQLPSQRAWLFTARDWVPKGTQPSQGMLLKPTVVTDAPLDSGVVAAAAAAGGMSDVATSDQGPRGGAGGTVVVVALPPPPVAAVEYECIVYTGSKFGAGTDATISMEMQGNANKVVHTFDTAKKLFERGSVDRFRLRVPDVGDLKTLRVWTDGSGFASAWFLDKVTFEHLAANCKWEVPFNAWVRGGEDRGLTRPARLVTGTPPTPEALQAAAAAASATWLAQQQVLLAQRQQQAAAQQLAAQQAAQQLQLLQLTQQQAVVPPPPSIGQQQQQQHGLITPAAVTPRQMSASRAGQQQQQLLQPGGVTTPRQPSMSRQEAVAQQRLATPPAAMTPRQQSMSRQGAPGQQPQQLAVPAAPSYGVTSRQPSMSRQAGVQQQQQYSTTPRQQSMSGRPQDGAPPLQYQQPQHLQPQQSPQQYQQQQQQQQYPNTAASAPRQASAPQQPAVWAPPPPSPQQRLLMRPPPAAATPGLQQPLQQVLLSPAVSPSAVAAYAPGEAGGTVRTGSPPRRPGDDGIAAMVLAPEHFAQLPSLRGRGPERNEFDRRLEAEFPEPACDWTKHTAPYPQPRGSSTAGGQPAQIVTYYHNARTGESTYDVPQDYQRWEKAHTGWARALLKAGVARPSNQ